MDEYYMELIASEVKNFDRLKNKYNYADVDDLIAHYIEEEVITSEDDLLKMIEYLKLRLGLVLKPDTFN